MKASLMAAMCALPLILACPNDPSTAEAPPSEPGTAAPAPEPAPEPVPAPSAAEVPAEPSQAAVPNAPEAPAAPDRAEAADADAPSAGEPVGEAAAAPDTKIKSPYDLPEGGAVGNVADKLETARQLVDKIGVIGLQHVAKMQGRAPDGEGDVKVNRDEEKQRYVGELESTYREIRRLMGEIAKCKDADPSKPTMNARSPASKILDEIERYKNSAASEAEVDKHVTRLKPVIVELKAAHVDTDRLAGAMKDPSYSVPAKISDNWCVR